MNHISWIEDLGKSYISHQPLTVSFGERCHLKEEESSYILSNFQIPGCIIGLGPAQGILLIFTIMNLATIWSHFGPGSASLRIYNGGKWSPIYPAGTPRARRYLGWWLRRSRRCTEAFDGVTDLTLREPSCHFTSLEKWKKKSVQRSPDRLRFVPGGFDDAPLPPICHRRLREWPLTYTYYLTQLN